MLLDRWTEVVDHELGTASTTAGYVRRTIRPALGDMPLRKLQHRVDVLDRLYTHLRRCNRLCDSSPAQKAGGAGAEEPHLRRPMSPGAVRRVHAILSAALNYAVSWGWIERNPSDNAHPPKLAGRRALPPRPVQVAELLNAAAAADEELAVFLWLAVTSGARRGELVALLLLERPSEVSSARLTPDCSIARTCDFPRWTSSGTTRTTLTRWWARAARSSW